MIEPYPRYAERLALRGASAKAAEARARAAQFSVDDLRDLQVWHKLAWVDAFYFDRDVRIRSLVEKGRHFTEDDKALLRREMLTLPDWATGLPLNSEESVCPYYTKAKAPLK